MENRWYKEVGEDRVFDPCPEILVSKVEFDGWCRLKRIDACYGISSLGSAREYTDY